MFLVPKRGLVALIFFMATSSSWAALGPLDHLHPPLVPRLEPLDHLDPPRVAHLETLVLRVEIPNNLRAKAVITSVDTDALIASLNSELTATVSPTPIVSTTPSVTHIIITSSTSPSPTPAPAIAVPSASTADSSSTFVYRPSTTLITPDAAAASSPRPSHPAHNSIGLALGIVFGLIGLVLIIAMTWFCIRRRRRTGLSPFTALPIRNRNSSDVDDDEIATWRGGRGKNGGDTSPTNTATRKGPSMRQYKPSTHDASKYGYDVSNSDPLSPPPVYTPSSDMGRLAFGGGGGFKDSQSSPFSLGPKIIHAPNALPDDARALKSHPAAAAAPVGYSVHVDARGRPTVGAQRQSSSSQYSAVSAVSHIGPGDEDLG